MILFFRGRQLRGAVATAAIFLAGAGIAPVRASDDLPIVGDIRMPTVDVDVQVGDDIGPPPPLPRPRLSYPRGPFAAIPPSRFEGPSERPVIPPYEIASMLRSTGYAMLGPVNRRGWVYTAAVLNRRGDDGRVIIDARTGAIIRFVPAFDVNPRFDDELSMVYGPPGPPPIQDFRRAPRPPMPVPKVASRMPSGPVTAPAAKSDSKSAAKADALPVQHASAAPQKQAEAPAAPPLQPETKPSAPELLPTKPMPDVQPLD